MIAAIEKQNSAQLSTLLEICNDLERTNVNQIKAISAQADAILLLERTNSQLADIVTTLTRTNTKLLALEESNTLQQNTHSDIAATLERLVKAFQDKEDSDIY
jgi:hypothetical protein